MSTLSNYLENKLVEHAVGKASFTSPTNTYLALFTSNPADDGSGLEVLSGTGYSRQALTWGSAVDGTIRNTNTMTFEATSSFGLVTHAAIFDASSSGNLLFYGALTTPAFVDASQNFVFNAGDIQVGLA